MLLNQVTVLPLIALLSLPAHLFCGPGPQMLPWISIDCLLAQGGPAQWNIIQ